MAIENQSLMADSAASSGASPASGGGGPDSLKSPAGVAALKKQLAKLLLKSLVKGDTW